MPATPQGLHAPSVPNHQSPEPHPGDIEAIDAASSLNQQALMTWIGSRGGRMECPACEGQGFPEIACPACGDRGTIPIDPSKRINNLHRPECRCDLCAPSPKLAPIVDPRYELSIQIGLLSRRVSSLTGNLCDAVARLDTDAESIDAAAELIAVTAQKLGDVALRIKTLSAKAERLDRSIAAGRRASLGAQERCA